MKREIKVSLFQQKKKREEAENLRKLEEERLRKAMAADAARKEAERLHQVILFIIGVMYIMLMP